MIRTRYDTRFAELRERGDGAFIPFLMIGDPDLATSERLMMAAIEGGADALEVGIPFTDPLADGPTIQASAMRALRGGATTADCLRLLARVRAAAPDVPIGILAYANLVAHGDPRMFYGAAAAAGVDSVLIADVPLGESDRFVVAAGAAGVAPVLIAPPDASLAFLRRLAERGSGYTYCVARAGVTGADEQAQTGSARAVFEMLARLGAPPPILGFGISRPDHVRAALASGAFGVVSGSAVIARVAAHLSDGTAAAAAVRSFVAEMKLATRGGLGATWRAAELRAPSPA